MVRVSGFKLEKKKLMLSIIIFVVILLIISQIDILFNNLILSVPIIYRVALGVVAVFFIIIGMNIKHNKSSIRVSIALFFFGSALYCYVTLGLLGRFIGTITLILIFIALVYLYLNIYILKKKKIL
jgi:hypothetical protein